MCFTTAGLMLVMDEPVPLVDGSSTTYLRAPDGSTQEVQVEPIYPGKWPHTDMNTPVE